MTRACARAHTQMSKKRGYSCGLEFRGFHVNFLMYWEDGDQLLNRPIVAVVDFCLLLAYVRKSLLLSQASFLQFNTHTNTHVYTHAFIHVQMFAQTVVCS